MYKTVKVSPNVVRPLRHKVLRPNLPFEASCLPSDNAPVTAFGFYEKMGFTILGKAFNIPKLGPHKTGIIEL